MLKKTSTQKPLLPHTASFTDIKEAFRLKSCLCGKVSGTGDWGNFQSHIGLGNRPNKKLCYEGHPLEEDIRKLVFNPTAWKDFKAQSNLLRKDEEIEIDEIEQNIMAKAQQRFGSTTPYARIEALLEENTRLRKEVSFLREQLQVYKLQPQPPDALNRKRIRPTAFGK